MADEQRMKNNMPPIRHLLNEGLIGAVIFIGLFCLYFLLPIRLLNDSMYAGLLAENLVTRQSFNLRHAFPDGFDPVLTPGIIPAFPQPYQLQPHSADGTYYWYPPGASIFSVPIVGAMRLLGWSAIMDGKFWLEGEMFWQQLLGAFWSAVFGASCWFFARQFLHRPAALLITLLFALGTSILSVNSRGLWAESVGVVVMLWVLWLLLVAIRDRQQPPIWLLATLLAWLFFIRPTYAFVILPMTVFVGVTWPRLFLRYALVGAAWAVGFALWSYYHFQHILPDYYRLGQVMNWREIPFGLAGSLLSPSRGLLVYSPFLLCLFPALPLLFRHQIVRPLVVLSLVTITIYLLVLSSWPNWWGGHSYGPRLTTGLLPWLFVLLVIVFVELEELRGKKAIRVAFFAIVMLLGILSTCIHLRGTLKMDAYDWNFQPVYIDTQPERLWDVSRPQILAGLEESRPGFLLHKLPSDGLIPITDEYNHFLLSGWAVTDRDGRWTEGNLAVLMFGRPTEIPNHLCIDLMPNTHPDLLPTVFGEVFLNGQSLGDFRLTDRYSHKLEFSIPDDALGSANVLEIRIPDAASPEEFGQGNDSRLLGFWVSRIHFSKT